jgi:phasin family protein
MESFTNNRAMRSHMESQVNFMTELSQRTYESVRRVGELNMRLAQQMIDDSMNMGRELMQCSDPFQATTTAIQQLQPCTEHIRSYQRELISVLSGAQAEMARVAGQRMPDASRSASEMADAMVRNAGAAAGSGAAEMGAAHNPT